MQQTNATALDAPAGSARGWVLIGAPILAIVLFFGAMIAATIAAMVAIRPMPDRALIERFAQGFAATYQGQMGVTIAIYLAVFIAIWLLLPKRGPASLASYFRPVASGTVLLALASGIGFAFLVGVTLAELSIHGIVTFHATRGEQALLPHNRAQLGIALLAIAVIGPLVEELYFRGVMLRWLRSKMPLAVAAIPDAALFAATHFRFATHVGLEGIVLTSGLFLFGLFAVAWASGTRSLWPSVAAHGMYNATLIGAPLLFTQRHG